MGINEKTNGESMLEKILRNEWNVSDFLFKNAL